MWDKLNLEKQFTFYASYHNNRVNVAIHLLCIPILLATGLVIFQVRPSNKEKNIENQIITFFCCISVYSRNFKST